MKASLSSILSVVVLLSCAVGCGSLTRPKGSFDLVSHRITIHTEPKGAEVVQLRPLGQPPAKLGVTPIDGLAVAVVANISQKNMPFRESQELLRHANNAIVRITKEGYEPRVAIIQTRADDTAALHVTLDAKEE